LNATQGPEPGADARRSRPEKSDDQPVAPGRVRADSNAESGGRAESRWSQAARSSQFVDEKGPEPKPVFDLSALLKDPEFREIHTRPVLDALELLSQAEPRHRLLGALRIGVSGPEARTALPALRQFLGEEANQSVRLRVAEAILKLQPNDRAAIETLSRSLIDPNDAELRQAAAGALSGAAAAGNPTAIVRLTDALDDPAPRVRIMAALSLAQFGPAAIDAVPRLEMAAGNDVPRMQRAALAALASIRGHQGSQDSASAASSDSRMPIVPPAFAPTGNPSALPPNVGGTGSQRTFEPRAVEGSGSVQLWQTIPARGISLHEIGSDEANGESLLRHQSEPPRLPDVPARPLERASEPVTPRPGAETQKPTITPPPLSVDSPLSLEPQSGAAKAGSQQ
jgi:hypothetical protein